MPKSSKLTRGLRALVGFRQENPIGATEADVVRLANEMGFDIARGADGTVAAVPKGMGEQERNSFSDAYSNMWGSAGPNATRALRFRSYEEMDASGGLGTLMLDTYADEVVNISNVTEKSLSIEIDGIDAEIVNKIKECLRINNVLTSVREDIRSMCKYGDMNYLLEPVINGGSFVQLDKDTINEATVIDKPLQAHQISLVPVTSPQYELAGVAGRVFKLRMTRDDREYVKTAAQEDYQPWQFAIFSIKNRDTFPYGSSVLESSRIPWEQLMTVEQLLALTRANKVDRINVSVPMPAADPMSALMKLNQLKTSLKNMFIATNGNGSQPNSFGAKDGMMMRPRDVAFTEYLFTPETFKVQRLSTSTDIGSIEDVGYFRDNFITASGLPKGYFLADKSDTRPGTLRQQDIKFARKLIPISEAYSEGLTRLIKLVGFYLGADLSKMVVSVSLKGSTFLSSEFLQSLKDMISVVQEYINLRKQIEGEEWNPSKDDIKNILSYVDMPTEIAFKSEDMNDDDTVNVKRIGNVLMDSVTKGLGKYTYTSKVHKSLQEVVTL